MASAYEVGVGTYDESLSQIQSLPVLKSKSTLQCEFSWILGDGNRPELRNGCETIRTHLARITLA